jgi:hypothetical protein
VRERDHQTEIDTWYYFSFNEVFTPALTDKRNLSGA